MSHFTNQLERGRSKGRYAFVSLGCPKNLVDSERMLGLLRLDGYELVNDPKGADFAVVNTCGFIEAARQESFAAIDFERYKLNRGLVARMKSYAPILHPFPRDQHFGEIPPEIDADPRAMYFRQARNGMWIRAALLAHICDADHRISQYVRNEYAAR